MTQDDLNRLQRKIVDGGILTSHEALDLILDLCEARATLNAMILTMREIADKVQQKT